MIHVGQFIKCKNIKRWVAIPKRIQKQFCCLNYFNYFTDGNEWPIVLLRKLIFVDATLRITGCLTIFVWHSRLCFLICSANTVCHSKNIPTMLLWQCSGYTKAYAAPILVFFPFLQTDAIKCFLFGIKQITCLGEQFMLMRQWTLYRLHIFS